MREPLIMGEELASWGASGSCAHQAEVGRRILRERFGVEAAILVGDLMRPMGGGRHHSYTLEDGSISVEAGACHAWLRLDGYGSYIDLAARELPARMLLDGHPAALAAPRKAADRCEARWIRSTSGSHDRSP